MRLTVAARNVFQSWMFVTGVFAQGAMAMDAENKTAPLAERKFDFTYSVEIEPVPAGSGPVDVFVPLAKSDEHQEVLSRQITASIPGAEKSEQRFGNLFWHGHVEKSDGKPITVSVQYTALRKRFERDAMSASKDAKYTKKELEEFGGYLKADALVPVSGELIDKVRKDIPDAGAAPQVRAKAIYNYVVDTMEYKKVGTGWGNGDTAWACSNRYGNCTDFHSLFISLARADGIPARFEIGFSIPDDKQEGDISGYHCWAEFYLPSIGWVPIDASEAKKNLAKRELFFGTHPADRFQFTMGRDLALGDGNKSGPLNFFIYPHVEVAGQKLAKEKMKNSFKFASASAR